MTAAVLGPAVVAVVAAAFVGTSTVLAQDRQAPAGQYIAGYLGCARFNESVLTKIRGQSGSAVVQSQAGRTGLLVVAAQDVLDTLTVEAWYEALEVWRVDGGERESPDTDGLVGGRYRGWLSPQGEYHPVKQPFVPAEVAAVAEMAGAPDDFFPQLPRSRLAAGAEWQDSSATIRRLTDRREHGIANERYQWSRTRRVGDRYRAGDSLAVTLDQLIKEQGELLWSPTIGPLSWSRRITITARIPPTGGVKRPMQTVVDQEIDVVRQIDPTQTCH